MNLGQTYSTSHNCGLGHLIGGPYDGDTYFADYAYGVTFCNYAEKVNHTYLPERPGSWLWRYDGPWYWNPGEREYESWSFAASNGETKE
jgi:hypothetical protein